ARVWAVSPAKRSASSPVTARNSSRPCRRPWLSLGGRSNMNQVHAEPLCNSRAGGRFPWTRVGGGAGNWAWGFGRMRTFHDQPTPFQDMSAARRFPGPALEELAKAKILGVRAGTEHRYTGVWVVVVEGRVFVRSWNDKPTGWYRAFQAQPLGSI